MTNKMETSKNKFFDSDQKSKISDIKKKTWPELFQKILEGKKNSDVRLADFDMKQGDVIIFEEYDPKTESYTGRIIKKKVKNLTKLNLTNFNSFEDFKKYGHWLMEFE